MEGTSEPKEPQMASFLLVHANEILMIFNGVWAPSKGFLMI